MPGTGQCIPAGHNSHSRRPVELEKEPGGHGTGAAAAIPVKVPAGAICCFEELAPMSQ